MDLSFYPLTLEAFDQATAEALCLFVGEDERPLVGLSGLCDWRLAGGLSRMLRSGLVKGEEGEALLTPGFKLGFRKLFLFGMGPLAQSDDDLAARVAERLRRLGRAGVEDAAFQIPPRLSLDLGIRTLIDEPNGPLRARVFGADPAAMVRALSQAASRGSSEARHERRVIKVAASHKPPPIVRFSKAPKQTPVEIPKVSPLPFAPQGPRPALEPMSKATPAESAADAQAQDVPIAPPASEPPDAQVPIAPAADPTPPPPAALEASAAVSSSIDATAAAPGQAELPLADAQKPAAGKAPLPVDYKARRFVPPEPKNDRGSGKNKKRR